mmetsp:Transcript_20152/g.55550  ORF Transcript_20152/g.55550 Transcript_20152/m.55550 type:complete len:256 (-) Transcript_20152:932-1699(-)
MAKDCREESDLHMTIAISVGGEPSQPGIPRVSEALHATSHSDLPLLARAPLVHQTGKLVWNLVPFEPTVLVASLDGGPLDGLLGSFVLDRQGLPGCHGVVPGRSRHQDVAAALARRPTCQPGELLRDRHVVGVGARDDDGVHITGLRARAGARCARAAREVPEHLVHHLCEAPLGGHDLKSAHAKTPMQARKFLGNITGIGRLQKREAQWNGHVPALSVLMRQSVNLWPEFACLLLLGVAGLLPRCEECTRRPTC